MKKPVYLLRALREALGSKLDSAAVDLATYLDDERWLAWYGRIVKRAVSLDREIERNRRRVVESYGDFENMPAGRQELVWRGSPPQMLVALAKDLGESSFMFRFTDPDRSLQLAELALETVHRLDPATVASEVRADLEAEALGYLSNARRINSDLRGAEQAILQAEAARLTGTGHRQLRAELLSFRAYLEFDKQDGESAGEMLDRGIRLWRVLAQREQLGQALLDRAIVACWVDSAELAQKLILEAMQHTADPIRSILALSAFAERLARDGDGAGALRVACNRDVLIQQTGLRRLGFESLIRHCEWVTALAHLSLGDLRRAEAQLERVRAEYEACGAYFRVALVSLDLVGLYAARGDQERVKQLAREAYSIFRSQGLEQRALAATKVLHEAARAEEVTSELAVEVANFVLRSQYDKSLRFSAE